MLIPRYYSHLEEYIESGKTLVIYGPRRVGKTTLIEEYLKKTKWKYKLDSGDNIRTQHVLGSRDFSQIIPYAEGYDLLVIDEAQNVPNIGTALKILVDQVPSLRIIATGSSSFELSGQVGEPLTGRKHTITLFPVSQLELLHLYNAFELKEKVSEFLIYGSYPEVVQQKQESKKKEVLDELVNSYLFKDILALERIKGSKLLLDLVRLIAFQVGSEVSLNELSINLGIDVKTVARYLDLLEKAFVLINLRGYSKNLRSEIKEKSKYYFYDTGIRNAVISNFNPMNLRNDRGALWENFTIIERIKKQNYKNIFANNYFWRTWEQKEIDFVEEREGKLFAYEFKYSPTAASAPKEFMNAYPNAQFSTISAQNYLNFVT